jgi:hypothetical protein
MTLLWAPKIKTLALARTFKQKVLKHLFGRKCVGNYF